MVRLKETIPDTGLLASESTKLYKGVTGGAA
jgi:hypothetical protein